MPDESLSVVMPAYNECGSISRTVGEWLAILDSCNPSFELHVYDDGSTDHTTSELRSLKGTDPRLVVHEQSNRGHGPTVLRGYRAHAGADWIFQVDSDDEVGPETFPLLWSSRHGADLLIAGRMGRRSSAARSLISHFARWVVHAVYGAGIRDVNSPYRLIRCSRFREVFEAIPERTFAPNLAITGHANRHGLRVLEIEASRHERRFGRSSLLKWRLLGAVWQSFFQTVSFGLRTRVGRS